METRPLAGEGEIEQAWDLVVQCFGARPADIEGFREGLELERTLACVVEGRVVAFSRIRPFGQFLGGRRVPLAGYATVAVAPEHRGRGLASRLTTGHYEDLRWRGEPLAALYPASTQLYRRAGFELGGVWSRRRVRSRSLRMAPAPGGTPRRATRADVPAVKDCYRAVAVSTHGWLDRSDSWWRRILERPFEERHVYVVDRGGGQVDGYVLYEQRPVGPGLGYSIVADDVIARTPDAARALWGLLGSSSTMADTVELIGPPEHPLLLLLPEQDLETAAELRWMARLVDLPAAVAARGFHHRAPIAVDLDVDDPHCPWNHGRWRLVVEEGDGRAERGGAGDVRLGIGALSSLYTGYATPATLRVVGLLEGGDEGTDAQLTAAFAGPTPSMIDFF